MSPETLLTWAELRAALADPQTLWLIDDARPLWLIPALALLALGLPADRALAARGRNLAAFLLRLLSLALLLFALAQPRIERRVPDLAVVIAEDRSASMSPARLDDARALAARIRAGLPEGVPVVEVFDAPAEATDLTALLQRAVAAAPSARTRRVLLLTDGADRHGGPEGDAAARAAALAGASGVQLYPVPPGLPAPNGAVTGLALPDGLRGGTSAQAQVTLHLTEPAQGTLTLTVAGTERARRAVDLPAGDHTLTIPTTAPSPGLHPVEARLSFPEELTSLEGEALYDDEAERLIVLDGTPRVIRNDSRVSAGEPLAMYFSSAVNTAELRNQVLVYEAGGGSRSIPFEVRAVPRDPEDENALYRVDLVPRRELVPGSRIGVAIAPAYLSWGGESPGYYSFSLQPRPRFRQLGQGFQHHLPVTVGG
jgi:hypothetical protein